MKKNVIIASLCAAAIIVAAIIVATVTGRNTVHTHTFSDEWAYDETFHWRNASCGCSITSNKEAHGKDNAEIIVAATQAETGLVRYTCAVCGYSFEETLLIPTSITSSPVPEGERFYIGQTLSSIPLSGGEGSAEGSFSWTDPSQRLTASGEYSVTFTPDDPDRASCSCKIYLEAEQLTVTVITGENGSSTPVGTVNVDYGSDLSVRFTPCLGYAVGELTLDGEAVEPDSVYELCNITQSHTLSASFEESELTVSIICVEGTENAYTIDKNTITFTEAAAGSVYAIYGEMMGNIVVDVGDDAKFELELRGLTLISGEESAITIQSGDKVTLTAKKDTENVVYDIRAAVDDADGDAHSAAIYSAADLDIGGKGKLTVVSESNNGIHTKDDLEIKNLTLSVTCEDNALKGNDSVTVKSGDITLIARTGDGIKTSNSNVSEKGNQRGDVCICGGAVSIFAACDGIDASHDVIISEEECALSLDIFTDKYSEYSEEVTGSPEESDISYISFCYKDYSYSVKYYNSETDYTWVNAEYHSSRSAGRNTHYFFSYPKLDGYDKIKIFMYDGQALSQESDYMLCSDYMTPNDSCDTFSLSYRNGSFYYSWDNYDSVGSMGGMGGMGGMDGGNTDKGDHSAKGIKAANEITVTAGKISISSYDDSIHANNESALENGESATGNVSISGGELIICSNDDGVHGDGSVSISGGSLSITQCYEGIEGAYVSISGGDVSVISKDDGINATATSGEAISICGGRIYVCAKGDGIDSNSRSSYEGIVFSGGNTVVICNSNSNSAIDTEAGYSHTGGYVVAVTSAGMGGMGGMAGESYNCLDFEKVGVKTQASLSEGIYLTVSFGEATVTVRMPFSISATVVCLGSPDAAVSSSDVVCGEFDANGVCRS